MQCSVNAVMSKDLLSQVSMSRLFAACSVVEVAKAAT